MKKILKKNAGFTLIELMIVVAIIGILAAIAIPNFIRYQLKSKEAEAKAVIGGIRTSQEAFRGEADLYAPTGVNGNPAPGTVKAAWADVACPAGCGKGILAAACISYDCIGYKPTGPVYFRYTTTAFGDPTTTPEFAVEADSNLDADGNLNYNFYVTRNDPLAAASVADCSGTIQVAGNPQLWGEIYDCDPNFY